MSQSDHNHERISDDLQEVADVLRRRRPELEPLELDRVKLRAMSGARRSTSQKGFRMRSRMVAFLTVGMLALGTGTATAGLLNLGGGGLLGIFGGGTTQSASYNQYKPPCPIFFTYNGQSCQFDPLGFIWEFVEHVFCWISNGHGGFTWGLGNGWVLKL